MSQDAAVQANHRLVDRLIVEGALWSAPLIAAFRATPRHLFLDRVFQFQRDCNDWSELITREPGLSELEVVYSDRALITKLSDSAPGIPVVAISSSSQPSLMAEMLEDLNLARGQRVLEIGAGTGYNAALLAHVVGPGNVLSIDVDRSVLSEAWDHLRHFPERAVRLRHADGRLKVPDEAPFDRLLVTAATPDIEPAWLEELVPGGMLEAPVEFAPGLAFVVVGTVENGELVGSLTRAAYFMPLRLEGESGEERARETFPKTTQRLPAPWGGWFERRRPQFAWGSFVQALVFFGWLRGLEVVFRTQADGGAYGLSDGAGKVCWPGTQDWLVSGPDGLALGNGLYDAFLDAGGPRPSDFRLRIAAREFPTPTTPDSFLHQGPRCWQLWELTGMRRRGPAI